MDDTEGVNQPQAEKRHGGRDRGGFETNAAMRVINFRQVLEEFADV